MNHKKQFEQQKTLEVLFAAAITLMLFFMWVK